MCGEGGGSHREWCVWGGGEGVTVSGVCGEGGGGGGGVTVSGVCGEMGRESPNNMNYE